MAIIAIRQSWIDALNADQRKAAKWVARVGLGADGVALEGSGAAYTVGGSAAVWRVFSDSRWTTDDIAELCTMLALINRVSEGQLDGMSRAEVRGRALQAIENRTTYPDLSGLEEGADPFAYVRDNQTENVPGTVLAMREIPANANPV